MKHFKLGNEYKALGYIMTSLSWLASLTCAFFTIYYKDDEVMKMAQSDFLLILCVGGR